MNLIIIGSTGLVGSEFINILNNFDFLKKDDTIEFIASNKSKGKTINFKNKEFNIKSFEEIDFQKKNIFINCSSSELAKLIYGKIKGTTSIMIDNSSAFRLDVHTPLVVPHINFTKTKSNIYANPNCSTIILSCLLKPLESFIFKRIVVSTYQAASGSGKEGLDELNLQMKEYSEDKKLTQKFWKRQYVGNCFVHNSSLTDGFYNTEEMKLINETKKIFNKDELKITSTCIRVPTIRSHCESVNIEFENPITYDQIIKILSNDKNISLLDDKSNCNFPDTIISSNKNEVFVGHIRPDYSLPENIGWNFWISGDQILRGAAYNAFEILKKI